MEIVERAESYPSRCAVTGITEGPFVDTGHWGQDRAGTAERRYLLVSTVREAAGCLGLVEPDSAVSEELESVRAELEAARVELDKARRFIEAIDVIESADFRSRKKTGRPRKEEQ